MPVLLVDHNIFLLVQVPKSTCCCSFGRFVRLWAIRVWFSRGMCHHVPVLMMRLAIEMFLFLPARPSFTRLLTLALDVQFAKCVEIGLPQLIMLLIFSQVIFKLQIFCSFFLDRAFTTVFNNINCGSPKLKHFYGSLLI